MTEKLGELKARLAELEAQGTPDQLRAQIQEMEAAEVQAEHLKLATLQEAEAEMARLHQADAQFAGDLARCWLELGEASQAGLAHAKLVSSCRVRVSHLRGEHVYAPYMRLSEGFPSAPNFLVNAFLGRDFDSWLRKWVDCAYGKPTKR